MLLIGVNPRRHLIDNRLVHHQLAIIADINLETIHWTRRGPLEVESADVISRAMTRAFELLLGLEPSRGAAQVGALGEDRIETLFGADDPGAEVLFEFLADLTDHVVVGETGLELRRR